MQILQNNYNKEWSRKWSCDYCKSRLIIEVSDLSFNIYEYVAAVQANVRQYDVAERFFFVCPCCKKENDVPAVLLPVPIKDLLMKNPSRTREK